MIKSLYFIKSKDLFNMLLVSTQKVKLKKTYAKILYLSTAYQNTYVFLGMTGPGKDILVHCDQQGNALYEYKFDHSVDSFGMLTEKQVFIIETRKNQVLMVNLEQKKVKGINHNFLLEQSDQSEIQTFPESRLLCIKEYGRYNDNRFKLSYYGYPFEQKSKPVAVYESKDDEWTYEYLIRKGNNHSMIIWFKNRHDAQFQFKTFDLRDNPQGNYNHHVIKNTIGLQYNLPKVECAVCNAWEMKRGEILAVCISNKTQAKAVSPQGIVNNNFVVNTATGIVREAKFYFDREYNDYLIDYISLGHISMFRTFSFQDGIALTTPVYYIFNETETIIAQQEWNCSYKYKYLLPSFDNSTLIQGQYENGDVSQFSVKIKKIMDPKQIAMHFLLHINDQFDDDLLKDAIELLGHID